MVRLAIGVVFAATASISANVHMTSTLRAAPSVADSLTRFPAVSGDNLNGKRFDLPRDFEGALNLVVVAFQRQQQHDVDGWMPFLKTLAKDRNGVRIYELPTLGRRYRLMRSFIDGGMRGGIPDTAVRAATITLYIDKTPFRRALGLGEENRIYILAVDREGRVHARAAGLFTPESGAAFQLAVFPVATRDTPSPGLK
ncbi:MAG: hypothetical protein ABI625_21225 [bacterium]